VCLFSLLNNAVCQTGSNGRLYGKWITCKLIDSTGLGTINFESPESFITSIRDLDKKRAFKILRINADTIQNEESQVNILKKYLAAFYDLYHGSSIEFCADSTAIEHMKGTKGKFINVTRTFVFNSKTNHLILDKNGNSEELLIRFLSNDTIILSFYSEGINLLAKKAK
jgi:hypothetical protein